MVLRLYRILGRSDDIEVGRSVVECLMTVGTPQAAAILADLSERALSMETRRRCQRALRTLKFAGVSPVEVRKPYLGPVYSSIISAVDGVGSRMIWLARKTKRQGQ